VVYIYFLHFRKAFEYWERFYKPEFTNDVEEGNDTDLIACQMKRARRDTRDEFRIYLSDPVVDSSHVKDILSWWKVIF